MGWTGYYTSRTNKDECIHLISHFKGTCKKYVMKGNSFYALMTSEKGEDWVLLLLTQRYKGEFRYKDIQCSPYEHGGIPASILNSFVPSDEENAKWLKENLELLEKEKQLQKKNECNFGDVVHCKNTGMTISWSNGKQIPNGEDFFVRVDVLNPFSKKRTKSYRVVEKINKNGTVCFYPTGYRISSSCLKRIEILNKEVTA